MRNGEAQGSVLNLVIVPRQSANDVNDRQALKPGSLTSKFNCEKPASTSKQKQAQRKMSTSAEWTEKKGLAQMLKGGLIADVVNVEQAKIAEAFGAVAVMALERVPADIRAEGGVARMSDPSMILEIKKAVSIPVMAKARIGHFVEAQILEGLEVDYIDESEVLTMADEDNHINKNKFKVPFVCGARNLGEALRRIAEGAAMIRTKGEAGSGNVVEAVRHQRQMQKELRSLTTMDEDELYVYAKEIMAPIDLVKECAKTGRLPVVNFAAGGIATPADAALLMQLGSDGVFVGSGIFKSADPAPRGKAMVDATTHYKDAKKLGELSKGLGKAMVGISDLNAEKIKFRNREAGNPEPAANGAPHGTW